LSRENKSITVLVVDDEKMIRDLLSETLGAIGYSTKTAEDFDGAREILKNQTIDVVITDIMLSDKTGFELIKLVKDQYPNTPVLAISGKNISKQSIMNVGADGYLAKPFRIGVVEEIYREGKKSWLSMTNRML